MVETYYVHLDFKNKNGNWSINLPFVCDKCGVCCTLEDFLNAGKIQGTPEQNPEAYAKFDALKDELGKLFEESEEKYEKYVETAKCPFQTGNICSIYAIRPDGCRQFPNTPFGMLSEDCKALDRFKKQRLALKRGRASKETDYFTTDPIKTVKFSEAQYQRCIVKLRRAGITEEELALFKTLNL
ncbi:MAG: YkgJ family cysteine cluster protein [Candidatus Bathyarchaeia archaeon]|jgi:Fe-S-cluster containining protein